MKLLRRLKVKMPDFNPANPGDLVYPKYAVVTTEPISAALQINKGRLYATDAAANLIPATDLSDGFFQAMDTPEAISGGAGEDFVQVAGPRTRMLFTDPNGGLKVGEDVVYVVGTTDVATGLKTSVLYVGKVFEIYNLQSDNISQKYLSEVGDKIIVETVQA